MFENEGFLHRLLLGRNNHCLGILDKTTKQQLEDRRAKAFNFRELKQTIKLMKIVDDSAYYAFFVAPRGIRLQPGDLLKVKFHPDDSFDERGWDLVVCESFDWSYQGGSVGILKRPLVPLRNGATEEEKKAFRPLVGTILPAVDGNMDSPESCRALLESARPIPVLFNNYEPEAAEAIIFKALNRFLHSTYPNSDKVDFQTPKDFNSASMDAWSKVLLMHDNRVITHRDILGEDAGLIMERFNAKDQLDAIEYLRNTPVNTQGKAVAVVEGFPGVGKTAFLAHVVVCMLAQQPQAPIACICAANQPTDVLAKAVERAIEDTCIRQPDLAPFLRRQVVIRVYPTVTETKYSDDDDDDDDDGGVVVTGQQTQVRQEGTSQSVLETAELPPFPSSSTSGLTKGQLKNISNRKKKSFNRHIKASNTPLPPSSDDDLIDNITDGADNDVGDSALDKAETGTNEVEGPDNQSDTEDDEEEDTGSQDGSDTEKKKRKKRLTKRQRQDREVAAARLLQAKIAPKVTYSNYIAKDVNALPLTEEEYEGNLSRLLLKSALLSDGSFNLDDPAIKALFTSEAALDMAKSINKQLAPGVYGVKDTRFQIPEMSAAGKVLQSFLVGDDLDRATAMRYKQYSDEGETMGRTETHELIKDLLPLAIKHARQVANVLLTTPSQTNTTKFMSQFREVHALLIDEACLATIIDGIMLLSSFDTDTLILVGDNKQLTPQAPLIQGSQGLSRETSQNIMTYFTDNHWPKAQLYVQRRGCSGIMEIPSQLFYNNQIQDAPVAPDQFPLRDMVANALRVIFPESSISKPYLYINAVHEGEIMDHSTKSWMNLTSAAVNINLIEYLVTKCKISPSSMIVITHYTAQLRVYRHAISKLASDYPEFNFSQLDVHTTDSIQGGSADIPFSDSVRTQTPGFTDNPGRNCVALTRARSFEIVTANTQQFRTGRRTPIICKAFDIARKVKACVKITKDMDEHQSKLLSHRHV
ncbi:hypothetical protein BTUL_0178g00030 [Botrytis tulipae]|uniref:DNA2/NAM7 helicase-like C-terminal domain-containing protein n=1 Tax=Botrytis tulipae TaxID=87230 RepID=A0A4Z1EJ50_9HELO|nr:hypothetical protein BTUL_0178g00030 [Botrytis tulipae]